MRAAKDDQPFADEVYEAFAQLAKASGQRPVLLVDNLQLVFERLDNGQQHSLRELLMRPGSPILVGASPSPPPQTPGLRRGLLRSLQGPLPPSAR